MARYISTKTYGHNIGLSAAFRQWRASSHCRFLHGYSIKVRFEFVADELDVRNWVVDFGSLKSLKSWLENTFDHKCLVAEDDPHLDWFEEAHRRGIIDMVKVPATGCEKFAEMIFEATEIWLKDNGYFPRVRLLRVEVSEHEANSAIFEK
jgi:6-pyruvoyltetrahydropterin/6-carboxytetrahydropterin synthase